MMSKTKAVLPLLIVTMLTVTGMAFAQEEVQVDPVDIEFQFTAAEIAIVLIGVFAGLTTAYLGYRKKQREKPDTKFSITTFLDRVIIAVIASVPLAIGSATDLVTLNMFTLVLIYLAALGTSELTLQLSAIRGTKK